IINAARSFTLKSMIVASVWNDNLTLEITGKRGGSGSHSCGSDCARERQQCC
ncbi:unnamed protein product, partial [Rotaria sp. Silwood1]